MDNLGRFIQELCNADAREELYACYGKNFINAVSPTLEMANAWAKEKSASAATDTDYVKNI